MLPSVIGTIGSVPFGHHGPGRFRLNAAPIHSDINSRKQIGSESELVSVDLVKNTLWDSMVRSRSTLQLSI